MSKPKGAGDLRQRVGFERRTTGDDGFGNTQGDWSDLRIDRSCSLLPARGGESVQAARLAGSAAFDLWVRYDSETVLLTTADRVVDRRADRTFNITFGPEDMDGDRRWLLMQVVSGGADG